MSGSKCRHVEDRLDDFLAGELSEKERIRVEMHLGVCAHCRESLALWKGFVQTARTEEPEPLPPMVERRLAIAAAAERGPEPQQVVVNWKRWAVASCAVAAAAVFALVFVLRGAGLEETPKHQALATRSETHPQVRKKSETDTVVEITADNRRVIRVNPGTNLWLDKEAVVRVEVMRRDEARFQLESGRVVAEVKAPVKGYRFVVVTPSGEVEAKGTVFSVEVSSSGKERARVLRGVVEVRKTAVKGRPAHRPLTLRAGEEGRVGDEIPSRAVDTYLQKDACLVRGCAGPDSMKLALLEVARVAETEQLHSDAKSVEQPIESSVPVVVDAVKRNMKGSKQQRVRKRSPDAGYQVAPAESSGSQSRDSRLDTLVSLALTQRKAGTYPMAADTYRELIREFPTSAAARNALVSLGQLELVELGRPERALKYFEDYLSRAPSGFLAEEARLGQVRAFDRLRRLNDVIRAASYYLDTHPGGYAGAEVLRRRGDAKRKQGNCLGAVEDYHRIKTWWPGSRQNKHAAKGLVECAP